MTSSQSEHNRRYPRVSKGVRVRYRLTDDQGEDSGYGYMDAVTQNISEGGAFFELSKNAKLKDDTVGSFLLFKNKLQMEFFLNGSATPMQLQGRAISVEKTALDSGDVYLRGVGVEFTRVEPEQAETIRKIVKNLPRPE